MDLIVLDLEWNQSPNGKEFANKEIPFEIIEIGAIKLDEEMNIKEKFCELIRPRIYNEMHFKIQQLTHFDIFELRKGRDFIDVIRDFISWCGKDYVFCTWGTSDIAELQRNMKYYGMERVFKFPLIYYDVQKLFSIYYEDRKTRRSLEFAVGFLNIAKVNQFHRALSDAYYTGRVLKTLDFSIAKRDYSIDTFYKPRTKEDEITAVFDTYSKYISRLFDTKEKALQDKEVASTRCYLCGKQGKKKIRWFSDNSRMYYSLFYCDQHGYLKGKLRMKRDGDKYYVIKTIKLAGEEGIDLIKNKQKDIRAKRRKKRQNHLDK